MMALHRIIIALHLVVSLSNAQECLNARGQFKVKGEKYNCKDVQKDRGLCYKQTKFRRKCPALCEECDCHDTEGRFTSVIKGKMSCAKVFKKKESHCKDRDARMYCPETCGMCANSLTVAPTQSPKVTCSIRAVLEFPPVKDVTSYGIHIDSLGVKKENVEEPCQDGITAWGCFHGGNAAVFKSPTGEGDYSTSESAQIIQGADGTFHFNVQHVLDDLTENDQEGGLIPSTLTIHVNDDPKATFMHTSYDMHDLKVTVVCDSFCNCMIAKEEACSLLAELKYPEDPGHFGYHKDDVSVTKLGSDEICNKGTQGGTSWGCEHTGDAVIWNPEDTENNYYDYNFREIVDIPNMYSSTVYLDVKHAFHQYYEAYYDSDHRIQGVLYLYIDGQLMGTFTHPKNKNIDTHLSDGSINGAYRGNYLTTVTCDNQCNCEVSKENY